MPDLKVFLFWDNSNIFISAKDCARRKEKEVSAGDVRIHFTNLSKLAIAGREVGERVVVGSIPPEQRELWDRMEHDTGITPELHERGGLSGTEQGVDQVLQTHMLRACTDNMEAPQIAVLLTGDGRGFDDGIGFHADLERLYKNGWGVEVVAWDISCKRTLRQWAEKVGSYIRLEDYYESVTFIQGGRIVSPLRLASRQMSTTREGPMSQARSEVKAVMDPDMKELDMLRAEKAAKKKYERKVKRREEKPPRKSRRKRGR